MNNKNTFTYVNQVNEDFLLDIHVLARALDGYVELAKPIAHDPGMYSVIAQLPRKWAKGWYELAGRDKYGQGSLF